MAGFLATPLKDFSNPESAPRQRRTCVQNGLETILSDTTAGTTLSIGQRQLLCMSRALLKNACMLLMDEATSNVDSETETVLQGALRYELRNCTVLTVAHRLHTIIDSDRVLVLDGGSIVENDCPEVLMKKPDGRFRKLLNDSNIL